MTPPLHGISRNDKAFAGRHARGHVAVIDDDTQILKAIRSLLDLEGYDCDTHESAVAFLRTLAHDHRPLGPRCVLCDVRMPEIDGLELQRRLAALDDTPLLLMSGASGVEEAASAFRAGAMDFLVKPIEADILLVVVSKALVVSAERQAKNARQSNLAQRIALLTRKERYIVHCVVGGQSNPDIARTLGISPRTVKLHRHRAMEKLDANTLIELVRIVDEGGL
ncbi:Response regulator transcription factor [Gammaproteobacteria bacterium]